jgi:lipopolysaccharide exporter
VLFGNKWVGASALCSLLSVLALVNALQVFFYPTLLASGVKGRYVALSVSQAVGVLIACFVGIKFGVSYVVIGLILNSLVQSIPVMMVLRRQIGLSPRRYCKPCLIPACAALVMLGMVQLANFVLPLVIHPGVRLICQVAIGASVYLGFLLIFSRATMQNLMLILEQALKGSKPVSVVPPN